MGPARYHGDVAKRKRNLLIILGAAVVILLVAVAMIVVPILTHKSGGSSGQTDPGGFVTEVTATGDDGRTRTLRATDLAGKPVDMGHLQPGETLRVEGEGFDASNGIYVSFCKVPTDPTVKPGPCLGGIPENAQEEKDESDRADPLESAWITNNWAWRSFASHQYLDAKAGTFRVELVVPPASSEGVDCSVDACGLFTRADHTAPGDRVQDVFLPIRVE
ncbi:hypothetical protein JSO19_03185 [Leucobacter sp. UCMA 4100]|nr:hypothetical protein [Leucobacter sp. UCMA 4100]